MQLTSQVERFGKTGANLKMRADVIESDGDDTVIHRFVLADEGAQVSTRKLKHPIELIATGIRNDVVEVFLELVGDSWAVGAWAEEIAKVLIAALKGNHRISTYGDGEDSVRGALDAVKLKRPCPVPGCDGVLEFDGWMDNGYVKVWITVGSGKGFWGWAHAPPTENRLAA